MMLPTLDDLMECYQALGDMPSKRDTLKEILAVLRGLRAAADVKMVGPDTEVIARLIQLYTTLFQTGEEEECVKVYYEVKEMLDKIKSEEETQEIKIRKQMVADTAPKVKEIEEKIRAKEIAENKLLEEERKEANKKKQA